jgi:hypothetical protein
MPKPKTFRATLERTASRLNWVIMRVPFDVAKLWATRGCLKVKGDINGFPFRTSLFPDGKGGHAMIVNKRMQAGAGAKLGSTVQFRLEPDTEQRAVAPPPELKCLLAQERSFRRWYDALNYSTRKDIANCTEVKSPEARNRRAEQIAERLTATMEAERVLPAHFARSVREQSSRTRRLNRPRTTWNARSCWDMRLMIRNTWLSMTRSHSLRNSSKAAETLWRRSQTSRSHLADCFALETCERRTRAWTKTPD